MLEHSTTVANLLDAMNDSPARIAQAAHRRLQALSAAEFSWLIEQADPVAVTHRLSTPGPRPTFERMRPCTLSLFTRLVALGVPDRSLHHSSSALESLGYRILRHDRESTTRLAFALGCIEAVQIVKASSAVDARAFLRRLGDARSELVPFARSAPEPMEVAGTTQPLEGESIPQGLTGRNLLERLGAVRLTGIFSTAEPSLCAAIESRFDFIVQTAPVADERWVALLTDLVEENRWHS